MLQRFERTIKMVEGEKILDIGCHQGEMTVLLSEKCGYVVGIDLDESNIQVAQQQNKKRNISYRVMNAEQMWFEKETFDCIVVAEVLEHIHSPYDFLRDINKILVSNGALVISTPNPTSVTYFINMITVGKIKRLVNKLEKESKGAGTEVDHIFAWGFPELYRLLMTTGFKYEDHAFAGYYMPNILKRIGINKEVKFLSFFIGRFGADMIIKVRKVQHAKNKTIVR